MRARTGPAAAQPSATPATSRRRSEDRPVTPAASSRAASLPVLLDIGEVAAHLNVTVRHVRRLVFERRIPYIKVGALLRFDPEEVAAWIEESTVPSHRR